MGEGEPAIGFKAQHGEDRILAREFGNRRGGYYVEVGSYNGESFSNTFYFEKALGWTGVLVEADPKLHAQGSRIRPGSKNVNCAAVAPGSPAEVTFEVVEGCRWVSSIAVADSMLKRIEDVPVQISRVTVAARTLDSILEEAGAPDEIDFVTVDVEGFEYAVLQGFTPSRWKPKVIILERNTHLPEAAIMQYMHRHGYGWRRTTGCNDWFYAGATLEAHYRLRVASRFYTPKYLTIWKPALHGPVKRRLKRVLRQVGLFDAAKSALKRKRPTHASG